MSRDQLVERGFSRNAIEHRLSTGRLHRVHVGVYAVGHPNLDRHGHWMAAVLACGSGAALSHASAAALYRLSDREQAISVSVPRARDVRRSGLRVHRVDLIMGDTGTFDHIPVTSPARTLSTSRRGSLLLVSSAPSTRPTSSG